MSKTKPKKVYISGPITGKDYKEVLVAFQKGEKAMRNIGLRTVNPTTWWGRWHWIFEKLPYGLQLFICMCSFMDARRSFSCRDGRNHGAPNWKRPSPTSGT